jgi:hypothetical protein
MTRAEQREAAQVLRRVVERIDQGEVEAPAWYRERLVGRCWRSIGGGGVGWIRSLVRMAHGLGSAGR